MKEIDEAVKETVIGHFFSEVPSELSLAQAFDVLVKLDHDQSFPDGFLVWEPFEHYPEDWIMGEILGMEHTLSNRIKDLAHNIYEQAYGDGWSDYSGDGWNAETKAKMMIGK